MGDDQPDIVSILASLEDDESSDASDDVDQFPVFELAKFEIPGIAPDHDCATERKRLNLGIQQGHKDVVCGVCTQHVGVFRRGLYGTLVKILIKMVHRFEQTGDWIKVSDMGTKGGDYAKLIYWGFLEKRANTDPEKSSSGEFRPTPLGIDMAHGKIKVPKHAYVFVGECYGFGEEWVFIDECTGKKFTIQDIWAEVRS